MRVTTQFDHVSTVVLTVVRSTTPLGDSMFQRSPTLEPKTIERRTARPSGANGAQPHLSAASSGEKSVIGNDLKIMGQGLKIIGRGTLQVDGEIEGDVQAVEVI